MIANTVIAVIGITVIFVKNTNMIDDIAATIETGTGTDTCTVTVIIPFCWMRTVVMHGSYPSRYTLYYWR